MRSAAHNGGTAEDEMAPLHGITASSLLSLSLAMHDFAKVVSIKRNRKDAINRIARAVCQLEEQTTRVGCQQSVQPDAVSVGTLSNEAKDIDTKFSVRRPSVGTQAPVCFPGIDAYNAIVLSMVLCKQDPKFASKFAEGVLCHGKDPFQYHTQLVREEKSYRPLYLEPIQQRPVPVPGVSKRNRRNVPFTECTCFEARKTKKWQRTIKDKKNRSITRSEISDPDTSWTCSDFEVLSSSDESESSSD